MGTARDQPAVERVVAAARRSALLDRGGNAVVLISGGRDSVCLLDVAATLMAPRSLLALHVNYGLRPEAGADEQLCAELCRRLGVALEVVHARSADRSAGNLQAWARDFRYQAALERAERRDALVAVGHTATDQAETVLYRLAASPGRRALLGMAPRQGRVVRPLLAVTREQTAAYCTARGLPWRDDASNETDEFARGRVRHQLMPALRALHPSAEANVRDTAELLRDEADALDCVVADALAGQSSIALERLAQLPPAVARLVITRLAEDAAGRLVPGIGRRLEEIMALTGRGGTIELHVGGGLRALVEYGVLRMDALPASSRDAARSSPPAPVRLAVPGEVRFGDWRVRSQCLAPELAHEVLRGQRAGALDADAVGTELTVRAWRAGDRMRPAGLGGSRSLADLFTDRRIPRAARGGVPVVENDGVIAWVPGVAAAEEFRAHERTATAVCLTAAPRDRAGPGDLEDEASAPSHGRAGPPGPE
jgi:tRNA(Ile)-lysidine synthase